MFVWSGGMAWALLFCLLACEDPQNEIVTGIAPVLCSTIEVRSCYVGCGGERVSSILARYQSQFYFVDPRKQASKRVSSSLCKTRDQQPSLASTGYCSKKGYSHEKLCAKSSITIFQTKKEAFLPHTTKGTMCIVLFQPTVASFYYLGKYVGPAWITYLTTYVSDIVLQIFVIRFMVFNLKS